MKSKFDLTKFIFRQDHVLVKALREERVDDLVRPEQYDDKPEFGEVVKVGKEVTDLHVGDVVFFGKYSTEQTRNLGNDLFIIRQEDIKAVSPNTNAKPPGPIYGGVRIKPTRKQLRPTN
jgi:co-chaperonin GroES (HSP10)